MGAFLWARYPCRGRAHSTKSHSTQGPSRVSLKKPPDLDPFFDDLKRAKSAKELKEHLETRVLCALLLAQVLRKGVWIWGLCYDFVKKIVFKEFESHFPGRNQRWKSPFNVSFSYDPAPPTPGHQPAFTFEHPSFYKCAGTPRS